MINNYTNNINNDDTHNLEWEFNSVINYIVFHYKQFILLLIVFIIIYMVDYVSNINSIIYGVVQIPGINSKDTSKKASNPKKNKK